MEVVTTAVDHPGLAYFPQEEMPEPKYIKSEIVQAANMFIIAVEKPSTSREGSVDKFWHYYPVKISAERKGNFHEMEILPTVVREGYVWINNQLIYVPVGDLLRRHINVTRVATTTGAEAQTGDSSNVSTAVAPSPRRSDNQPGLGFDIEPEIREAIDLASQDQIDSLQYLENCEKGTW